MKKYLDYIRLDSIRAYQYHQSMRMGIFILVGIILVKMGMQVEDVSIFEWIIFMAHAMSFFWSNGMKNAMLSYKPATGAMDEMSYLKSTMYGFLWVSLIFGLLIISLDHFNFVDFGGLTLFIAAYLIFNVPSSLMEHIFLYKRESVKIYRYANISYIAYLVLIIGGYHLAESSLQGAIIGLLLWGALRFLYFNYYLLRLSGRFNGALLKSFLVFSFPIMLYMFIGQGMEFVDGILVKYYFEDQYFAIYRFGARELPFNTVLISSMVTAAIPLAVQNTYSALHEVRSRVLKMIHWLFPISIVLVWISPMLFSLVFSEDYAYSADIFNVYLLIIITRILLPQIVIYAYQKNQILVIASVLELTLNVVLSLWFLQIFGLIGIAYATFIAFALEKIILVGYTQMVLKIKVSEYLPVYPYCIYSILLIAVFYFEKWYMY